MKNILFNTAFVLGVVLIIGCKKKEETPEPATPNTPTQGVPNTPITDIDGNIYQTVTIGTQVWMAENLKTTKYRNGDLIGTTTPTTKDISTETNPKYQWACNGNDDSVSVYGRLYTWYAATDSRNVCPLGWHIPTSTEWTTLINYLGGASIAGGRMKATGTTHWQSPNTGADNFSGFAALPAGGRYFDGTFGHFSYYAQWWSATEDPVYGISRDIIWSSGGTYGSCTGKTICFSIRCVKD